ncbi:hypothetical protein SHL15_7423 [Streptomyces hygroscopicus subsp. limoneus]|nr:hypothetical protein SHL15_7423 [Streptomyces hygroscopicus subsp. limoneus]
MHHLARTAPCRRSARRFVVAVLAAVALTLLTAAGLTGLVAMTGPVAVSGPAGVGGLAVTSGPAGVGGLAVTSGPAGMSSPTAMSGFAVTSGPAVPSGPATTTNPATTSAPAAVAAAAAGHHSDAAPRADDGCDTVCTVRAAPRQEQHREHPAPRCHLGACLQGTAVAPPRPARLTQSTGHIPASDPHAPRDRGRAPPQASGT